MSETACPLCWLAPCICSSAIHIARLESELREARARCAELISAWDERPRDFEKAQQKADKLTSIIDRLRAFPEEG